MQKYNPESGFIKNLTVPIPLKTCSLFKEIESLHLNVQRRNAHLLRLFKNGITMIIQKACYNSQVAPIK